MLNRDLGTGNLLTPEWVWFIVSIVSRWGFLIDEWFHSLRMGEITMERATEVVIIGAGIVG